MELIIILLNPQLAAVLLGAVPVIAAILVGARMSKRDLYARMPYRVSLTVVSSLVTLVGVFLLVAGGYAATLHVAGFPVGDLLR